MSDHEAMRAAAAKAGRELLDGIRDGTATMADAFALAELAQRLDPREPDEAAAMSLRTVAILLRLCADQIDRTAAGIADAKAILAEARSTRRTR